MSVVVICQADLKIPGLPLGIVEEAVRKATGTKCCQGGEGGQILLKGCLAFSFIVLRIKTCLLYFVSYCFNFILLCH